MGPKDGDPTGVGASERAMVCAQLIFICCSNQPKECAPWSVETAPGSSGSCLLGRPVHLARGRRSGVAGHHRGAEHCWRSLNP